MTYDTIIGLEVHAQLLTKSKMFCGCSADYASVLPQTFVCPICLGMPGVLPTINRRAVEFAIMTALALNCTIAKETRFDRKNYPYPDLMKGYQISQYDAPIGQHGWLSLESDGEKRRIGIRRVHLEEDVAKLWHRTTSWGESYSLMDVNRSGVPLLEIVSEPELGSPEEARQYLMKLRSFLQYLGVSSGNMEEGSFRCDANISLRPSGTKDYLPKVEIKNMNSFKAVYRALEYEVERQKGILESGGRLTQETRGWVDDAGVTVAQRTKEYAQDYRYFPEPDLPPLILDPAWIEEIRSRLPELPEARRERFMKVYALSNYDAGLLTASKALADYFEACLKVDKSLGREASLLQKRAKALSNWFLGEFSRLLNVTGGKVEETKVKPEQLMELLNLIDDGTLSSTGAKVVFEEMFYTGKSAGEIVVERGLSQISDISEIGTVVAEVIKNNPQAVADFKAGKLQALTFLTGQVMRLMGKRANPQMVKELLLQKLREGENV